MPSNLPTSHGPPQHILILNLENNSVTTSKENKESLRTPEKDLWSFTIPKVPGAGEDCWDLFVDLDGPKQYAQT
ncbi:unnamed protein product [Discula destructiva]